MLQAQQKLKKEKFSDYFTWVQAVWQNSRGNPLDFEKRPFLIEVYQNQAPHMVFIKSAQMGLSERSISEAVWICDQKGLNSLYCFPAQTQLADFVQARLDPVLNNSPYLKERAEQTESDDETTGGKKLFKIGLKKIGKGFLYLRGSTNEKQIISIDADCVFMDERDRFNEDNVPYIEKRLLASSLKWMREISTPTYPGKGIHASYLKSDQRVWEIQCDECEFWQELDFFKHIDFENKIVVCEKCKTELNRIKMGRWRPLNPGSTIVGYKINGLYNPNASVEDIIAKYEAASTSGFSALQQFFNQDLGLPYEASGQSLSLTELNACKKDYLAPVQTTANCFAGADVGVSQIHMVVIQKTGKDTSRLVWAGTVKDFTGPIGSVEAVMEKYKIKFLVIDKKPEQTKVKELIQKFPGRVYAAMYPNMNFSVKEYYIFDDVNYEVKLDRTISIDYTIGNIQNQKVALPKNIDTIQGFYDQMMSSVRITEKNIKTGVESARWIEKSDDHFLHAFNYANIAQIRGNVGGALLDYYVQPETRISPNLIDWIRVNGVRLEQ